MPMKIKMAKDNDDVEKGNDSRMMTTSFMINRFKAVEEIIVSIKEERTKLRLQVDETTIGMFIFLH